MISMGITLQVSKVTGTHLYAYLSVCRTLAWHLLSANGEQKPRSIIARERSNPSRTRAADFIVRLGAKDQ